MAAHHARKPLPALPNPSPNPTLQSTLSLDARDHRGKLIRYFLADATVSEHEHGRGHAVGGRQDPGGWAWVIEEALDGMGYALGREGWLGRVRRGNAVKRAKREALLTVSDRSRQEEKGKGKEKEKDKSDSQQNKPLPEEPVSPLKLLRTLAVRPARPPSDGKAAHLVLCVAPHGSPTALPAEDSGFDIVPANSGCVFTPGSFVLQSDGVLFGLDDVDGV